MKPKVKRHEVVQPEDLTIKLIPLTQGLNATVDTADYEFLNQWNWLATKNHPTGQFYAGRNHNGKLLLMHRLLMGEQHPEIDHADGDALNNRRSNLRPCSHAQNMANRRVQCNNKAGLKGVSYSAKRKKWRAVINKDHKFRNIGFYETPEFAHAAYIEAAKQVHGEFART